MIHHLTRITSLTEDEQQKIRTSKLMYQRHAQVGLEVLHYDDSTRTATVRIRQHEPFGNRLPEADLHRIARHIFEHAPHLTIVSEAEVFEGTELQMIDADWVRQRMNDHGMKQRELTAALGLDESHLSKILRGHLGFTRFSRAAFYWFFRAKTLGAAPSER